MSTSKFNNLAIVIGINNYENTNKFSLLKNASRDATAIANILEGYQYKVIRLIDGNVHPENKPPTLDNIKTTLKNLPDILSSKEPNSLFFYFAGHGVSFDSNEKGPQGFLIPIDATDKDNSYLSMQTLKQQLEEAEKTLQNKKSRIHDLLIVLDCCHAGAFRSETKKVTRKPSPVTQEHYQYFVQYPSWEIMVAAAHNEESSDGKLEHSPFAKALLDGLNPQHPEADYTGDKIITSDELCLYVSDQLYLENQNQHPDLFPFDRKYDKGKFIFIEPDFQEAALKNAPKLDPENNPYRGLEPYEERHAGFFFGRELLTQKLLERIILEESKNGSNLTVVVGSAGSGKSSLVKAGLLPKIRELDKSWYALTPTCPGNDPFTSLARALLPITNPDLNVDVKELSNLHRILQSYPENIKQLLVDNWNNNGKPASESQLLLILDYYEQLNELLEEFSEEKKQLSSLYKGIKEALQRSSDSLKENPQFFSNQIKLWRQRTEHTGGNRKLLLIVDQIEELYTRNQSNLTARDIYLKSLKIALDENRKYLHLLVTLRSDFQVYFRSSPYWKSEAIFDITLMSKDELRQSIEKSAREKLIYFESSELVEQILDDARETLPLLSFTLSELYLKLYQRWQNNPNSTNREILRDDYVQMGRVAGALATKADGVLEKLEEPLKQTVKWVLLRMVSLDQLTRRRVYADELDYPSERENQQKNEVIEKLIEAHLLIEGQNEDQVFYEVAHDSLIREWKILRDWIQENRADIILQRQLSDIAKTWKYENASLWVEDLRLERSIKLNKKEPFLLNKLEATFIHESIKKKNLKKNFQFSLIALSGVFLITGFLVSSFHYTKALLNQSKAQENLAESQINLGKNWDALKISIQSILPFNHPIQSRFLRFLPSQESQILQNQVAGTLQKVLYQVQERNVLQGHQFDIFSVIFLEEDKLITTGYDNTIRLWTLNNGWQLSSNPLSPNPFILDLEKFGANQIFSSAHTPSNKHLVVGDSIGNIFIIKLTEEKLEYIKKIPGSKSLEDKRKAIRDIDFNKDQTLFATAGDDGYIKVWDLSGNSHYYQGNAHGIDSSKNGGDNKSNRVRGVSFSPINKDLLASVGGGNSQVKDYFIKLWHLNKDKKRIEEVSSCKLDSYPLSVKFSPDGQQVATTEKNGSVIVWDSKTLQDKKSQKDDKCPYSQKLSDKNELKIENPENNVYNIKFSPKGKFLIRVGSNKTLTVWERNETNKKWSLKTEFKGHQNTIYDADFSPNADRIASVSADSTIRLWSLEDQLNYKVVLSKDDPSIKKGFDDFNKKHEIENKIRKENKKEPLKILKKLPPTIFRDTGLLQINNNQLLFGTVGGFGIIKIFKIDNNQINPISVSSSNTDETIYSLSFSPDGKELATVVGEEGKILLWDLQAMQSNQIISFKELKHPLELPVKTGQEFRSVAFNKDGSLLAAAQFDGTVYIWHRHPSGELDLENVHSFNAPVGEALWRVKFSPSQPNHLVITGKNKTVTLWDITDTRQPIAELKGHQEWVEGADFNPQGDLLVTSDSGGNVLIWKMPQNLGQSQSPSQVHPLTDPIRGYSGNVYDVHFSPDSKKIAVADEDGKVRFWDWRGNPLGEFEVGKNPVISLSFTPDGKYLFTASADGIFRWPLYSFDELLQQACERLQDNKLCK